MGFSFSKEWKSFKDDPLRYGERLGNKIADETSFGLRKKLSDKLFGDGESPELPDVPKELDPQEAIKRIALNEAHATDRAIQQGIIQNQTQGFASQVVAGKHPSLQRRVPSVPGGIGTI